MKSFTRKQTKIQVWKKKRDNGLKNLRLEIKRHIDCGHGLRKSHSKNLQKFMIYSAFILIVITVNHSPITRCTQPLINPPPPHSLPTRTPLHPLPQPHTPHPPLPLPPPPA